MLAASQPLEPDSAARSTQWNRHPPRRRPMTDEHITDAQAQIDNVSGATYTAEGCRQSAIDVAHR